MTAAMIFVLVFVVVFVVDLYRWYNCRKAPLTEAMRKLLIIVRFSLSKEARAEFEKIMYSSSFRYAVKRYLKR